MRLFVNHVLLAGEESGPRTKNGEKSEVGWRKTKADGLSVQELTRKRTGETSVGRSFYIEEKRKAFARVGSQTGIESREPGDQEEQKKI